MSVRVKCWAVINEVLMEIESIELDELKARRKAGAMTYGRVSEGVFIHKPSKPAAGKARKESKR